MAQALFFHRIPVSSSNTAGTISQGRRGSARQDILYCQTTNSKTAHKQPDKMTVSVVRRLSKFSFVLINRESRAFSSRIPIPTAAMIQAAVTRAEELPAAPA